MISLITSSTTDPWGIGLVFFCTDCPYWLEYAQLLHFKWELQGIFLKRWYNVEGRFVFVSKITFNIFFVFLSVVIKKISCCDRNFNRPQEKIHDLMKRLAIMCSISSCWLASLIIYVSAYLINLSSLTVKLIGWFVINLSIATCINVQLVGTKIGCGVDYRHVALPH